MEQVKANVEKPVGNSGERPRMTREEIMDKKISMAKERDSRIMKISSPMGSIMFNVLRQFDQAYANFKGQLGEPGGVSHEEGVVLMDEIREITMAFSGFTGKLSKKVKFKYFVPQELQEMQKATSGKEKERPSPVR